MAIAGEPVPPPGWASPGSAPSLALFPQGQLSEIVGPQSAGGTSLLLAVLAEATGPGASVALVDEGDTLDPTAAAAAGVDLGRLLWARGAGRPGPACRAAELLARDGGFAVVALDLGEAAARTLPAATWLRLARAARDGDSRLIIRAPRRLVGSAAALTLVVERERTRWIGAPRPVRLDGLRARVRVERARGGALRGSWTVEWEAGP